MNYISVLGYLAMAITAYGVIAPSRQNMHWWMILANALWGTYGFLKSDPPLYIVSLILIGAHIWALKNRKT